MKSSFEVVQEAYKIRSTKDGRKRVNMMIISYYKGDFEYRKRYEFPASTSFNRMLELVKLSQDEMPD